MIICDPRNPRAQELWASLASHLPPDWSPSDELTVVVGGDGFLLETVAQHGLRRTYLGLNAGHLGFLLNDVASAVPAAAEAILQGSFTAHTFPLIEARMELASGAVAVTRAINDVYLERMTSQTARLQISIGGHVAVDQLVADGMIVATALGSTAYSFSAGGTPLHPSLRAVQVTPICPHLPRLTPFVLPPDAQVEVTVLHARWRPVRAVADGRGTDDVQRVQLKLSDDTVQLAYLEHHDFTRQMLRKIVHP
ncbi:MAG: NAD(+)/NADH kinase [Myxococcales bacterium]|nr:NAD(+)/NADH kinase [Myxococcales bacterium]